MISRLFPTSAAGRITFLAQLPIVLIMLFIFHTAPSLRRHVPDVLYVLWFLFLLQLLPLGHRIKSLELALQRLRRPVAPTLWAHTTRSIVLTALLFTLAFAFTFIVIGSVYPSIAFFLRLLISGYIAVSTGLLIGFMTSSADRILLGGGKL